MYQEPHPYDSGYGAPSYPAPSAPNAGMANTGMVLGIVTAVLGILGCVPFLGGGAVLTGVPAVACSWYALSQVRNSMGAVRGKGMAIAGICTGLGGIVIGVLTVIFWTWIATQE